MITDVVQRYRDRRCVYRPAREVITTSILDVAELHRDAAAAFVEAHHYSKSFPAERRSFGLYQRGELAGVAVFSRPFAAEVVTNVFPYLASANDAIELGRLVLLEEVAANAETWFLARCFEGLARRPVGGRQIRGVVSFSDPLPRTTLDGRTVMPGHVGIIYQGHNAHYLGMSERRTIRLLPDGTVFSNFSSGKIRRRKVGWRSCVAELVAFGAPDLAEDADAAERIAWLELWRGRLTRAVRHPGNHRYVWGLDRGARRALPPSLPYPKKGHRS